MCLVKRRCFQLDVDVSSLDVDVSSLDVDVPSKMFLFICRRF